MNGPVTRQHLLAIAPLLRSDIESLLDLGNEYVDLMVLSVEEAKEIIEWSEREAELLERVRLLQLALEGVTHLAEKMALVQPG